MKAIVCPRYGSPDVLELRDVETPTPKDREILIKTRAASVNAGDWHIMRADPFLVRFIFGVFKPKHKILGSDIAGVVEAVGKDVRLFKVGDEVFGDISECGGGAFAEYATASEDAFVLKPPGKSFEEAAAMPMAGVTALQGLRNMGQIQKGQKVLVHGASGGVGSFAVQIAKVYGTEVTAVCGTNKVQMVRSLGADHVIDYTKEDCTKNGIHYDLIIDAAAFRSISDFKRSLAHNGVYVMAGGSTAQMFQIAFQSLFSKKGGQTLSLLMCKPNRNDLRVLTDIFEENKLKPFIDKRFPLAEVADAIRYVENRQVQGKVVISV